MEALFPYLAGVCAAATIVAGVLQFAIRSEVRQSKSATDLAIATAVRERIEEFAKFREHVAANFASKDGVASWMREFKTDLVGRLNRIEAKIDRLTERTGHGHDD